MAPPVGTPAPPRCWPSGIRSCPTSLRWTRRRQRSEEHTSELQSRLHLVCRLLLEKKKKTTIIQSRTHSVPRIQKPKKVSRMPNHNTTQGTTHNLKTNSTEISEAHTQNTRKTAKPQ